MKKHLRPRPLLAGLLAAWMLLCAVPAYAASSEDIQDEIDELTGQQSDIQSQIDDMQSRIDGLEYQQAGVLEKKELLDRKNDLAAQELEVLQEQVAIADGMIAAVQEDLTQARAEESAQRERWLRRLRAMEETSSVSYIEVLFEATSFSDLLSRLDMVGEVMAYDEDLEAAYTASRRKVEDLEARAETMLAENEQRRQDVERKQAQLVADINAACDLIASMEGNIADIRAALEVEEATKAELASIIAEKQEELEKAKAAEGTASPGSVTGSGFIWPSYTKLLTSYYGPRYLELYGYTRMHAGVDIGASYGSQIWAAQAGTVITADWYGGYGKCVMVMHDNGYTTLYGHMSSIAVYNGQTVTQGQVLGYVGSTGNSTGPHLHFEIRSNANPSTTYDPESFVYYG